ncbi:MAG: L-glyceraldehyde 3-phosphate reductase [Bacteroidetes bacterium]|nr:L-glyceraldehyde 3-phosphate reductase [Bacteroidota bacterium]
MYIPSQYRYKDMEYNRCGRSGLLLPAISLGLWHNFGGVDDFHTARMMVRTAFDYGITHFDLANNYGPPPGSAEINFGRILNLDFRQHRDEIVVSTKAGYWMWDGPYGDWGSRKYLLASLDQSLRRLQLDYVDIFYHHRPDPKTPLEETMAALADSVKAGKALYVGISNYPPEQTERACDILQSFGVPLLIHQPKYNMFERWVESELLTTLHKRGIGCIAFSPLAQGLLTEKYLHGIPQNSRAAKPHGFLHKSEITMEKLLKIQKLNDFAASRGQSLAQMALAWVLRRTEVTSVLIGASQPVQILDAVRCLKNRQFSNDELMEIDAILSNG